MNQKNMEQTLNEQVGGTHYKKYNLQPVEFAMKHKLSFCCGNMLKYLVRYKDKNGVEDLRKVLHYRDLEMINPVRWWNSCLNISRVNIWCLPSVDDFIMLNGIDDADVIYCLRLIYDYHLTGKYEYLARLDVKVNVMQSFYKNI